METIINDRPLPMTSPEKFERCMVFAGGGFRFGCYLGMYAAAVETNNKPDILLAACGGAIAAAVIQALPDDQARRAWLASPEMYRFMSSLHSTSKAAIVPALAGAIARGMRRSCAPVIPDLFNDYLFDAVEHLPLPEFEGDSDVSIAIIGGKLLFSEHDVGKPRQGRKLFAETVFCNNHAAALLTGMTSPFADTRYGEHAIAPQVNTDTNMPLRDAVRISIADMFYSRCHSHASGDYLGGVVDLFPIEVAHRLAHRVLIELKSPFHQGLAIPAWRAVLGVDGNQRLREVHSQHADKWIDTSDISQTLKHAGVRKMIDWRGNRVRLVAPANYDEYVRQIDAQWEYGYRRALEAFSHTETNDKRHMRYITKHNWTNP